MTLCSSVWGNMEDTRRCVIMSSLMLFVYPKGRTLNFRELGIPPGRLELGCRKRQCTEAHPEKRLLVELAFNHAASMGLMDP